MNDEAMAAGWLYYIRKNWLLSRRWTKAYPNHGVSAYPKGRWGYMGIDKGFHPTDEEMDCCRAVSGAWRWDHCRTAKHIANLFGVDRAEVISICKAMAALVDL